MVDIAQKLRSSKAFLLEVMRRYRDDESSLAASSLAYTALLSLVPFMSVLVTVFSAMPLFNDASEALQDFLFQNFVPATGEVVQKYLLEFVNKARGLTVSMSLAVFVTSILMMHTMEKALNRIFDSKPAAKLIKKVMLYWTILTMGPLLVGGGIAMSSMLFKLSAFAGMKTFLLQFLPILSSMAGFFLLYLLIPNRKVNWRHALSGALFAAICFELAKKGFAVYVVKIPSYQKIYGAIAAIPLFLIWMFLSWNIILLGATITATLSSTNWRLRVQQYHRGQRFLLILELLRQLRLAAQNGKTVDHEQLANELSFVPDNELAAQLHWLQQQGLVASNHNGCYLLQRNLSCFSLRELYRRGTFKLPLQAESYFHQHQPLLDDFWRKGGNFLEQPLEQVFMRGEK